MSNSKDKNFTEANLFEKMDKLEQENKELTKEWHYCMDRVFWWRRQHTNLCHIHKQLKAEIIELLDELLDIYLPIKGEEVDKRVQQLQEQRKKYE